MSHYLSEMRLLYTSIKNDGYTMPIVTFYDAEKDIYTIVDGFHRYQVMKRYRDIREKNHSHLPVVVIDKPLKDRMASTVRHNRARGKHSIDGMGALVVEMLNNGWTDERVCGEIGLEKEELIHRICEILPAPRVFAGQGKRQPDPPAAGIRE